MSDQALEAAMELAQAFPELDTDDTRMLLAQLWHSAGGTWDFAAIQELTGVSLFEQTARQKLMTEQEAEYARALAADRAIIQPTPQTTPLQPVPDRAAAQARIDEAVSVMQRRELAAQAALNRMRSNSMSD